MRTPLHVITSALDTDNFTVEDLMEVKMNAEVSRVVDVGDNEGGMSNNGCH